MLIISGSPRKGGNTDLLCDAFARGTEEAGGRVEKIFLADYRIDYFSEADGMVKATGMGRKGAVKGSQYVDEAYNLGKRI